MRARLHRAVGVSLAVVTVATVLGVGADITPGRGATAMPSGTLTLNASLRLSSLIGGCPPPAGAEECAVRTIQGPFPGLGQVTGKYEFFVDLGPPTCVDGNGRVLAYPIRFAVPGRGEIHVAVAEAQCRAMTDPLWNQTQTFTITGGTGIYAGASGSGTLERQLGEPTATGRHGRESWKGILTVPGLEFDVTPPTLSGAHAKTVRAPRGAKRVRVTYAVTASDEVAGTVPVTCTPRSGSRFPIGRTIVRCSATDASANEQTARFTITVARRR
jgi:hypothetical protein